MSDSDINSIEKLCLLKENLQIKNYKNEMENKKDN